MAVTVEEWKWGLSPPEGDSPFFRPAGIRAGV
jgi:hypothetical protein